jgi:hypothetical protein
LQALALKAFPFLFPVHLEKGELSVVSSGASGSAAIFRFAGPALAGVVVCFFFPDAGGPGAEKKNLVG